MTLFLFLGSGDFKGNKFAVVGLYDPSACHKILLSCFPSLLLNHRQSTKGFIYAQDSNKQHMLLASPQSTSVIQFPKRIKMQGRRTKKISKKKLKKKN